MATSLEFPGDDSAGRSRLPENRQGPGRQGWEDELAESYWDNTLELATPYHAYWTTRLSLDEPGKGNPGIFRHSPSRKRRTSRCRCVCGRVKLLLVLLGNMEYEYAVDDWDAGSLRDGGMGVDGGRSCATCTFSRRDACLACPPEPRTLESERAFNLNLKLHGVGSRTILEGAL
jgi:hypothetical protein